MKALSVRQPWANMIASGEKTIETRTWRTNYRGPLLIVSSKRPKIQPVGCIVAMAELVGCRRMTVRDEARACCSLYPRAWAWELSDIVRVEPIPTRGQLSLYDLAIERQDLVVA